MAGSKQIQFGEMIHTHARVGELFRDDGGGRVECYACGHRCRIGEGKEGVCKIRFNRQGKLYVPWGYVSSVALDPIEKKPFYHALPGALALSFGMLGCDYHCPFCQNWITSQTLRDPDSVSSVQIVSPEEIVSLALAHAAPVITSTYNEPLITSEWAVEIFRLARENKLVTSYVSNGNATPEVIDYLAPWLDLFKIDLKGFRDKRYRELGGVLQNVLDTIRTAFEKKLWVEVVTLVVPGFNDSEDELRDIARFLKSVSPGIPWHVTAFHADYKMNNVKSTPADKIVRAVEIGYSEGLHFVYGGNIGASAKDIETTRCHSCGRSLIERSRFRVIRNEMVGGKCPGCGNPIPGFWEKSD